MGRLLSKAGGRRLGQSWPEGDQEPVRMDSRQEWGKTDQRISALSPSLKAGVRAAERVKHRKAKQ